jgi:hypothetical protein
VASSIVPYPSAIKFDTVDIKSSIIVCNVPVVLAFSNYAVLVIPLSFNNALVGALKASYALFEPSSSSASKFCSNSARFISPSVGSGITNSSRPNNVTQLFHNSIFPSERA